LDELLLLGGFFAAQVEAVGPETMINNEEVMVFRGLFVVDLLGGLFGVFVVGLAGHGDNVDESWEAIRS
jgi:hypothetical protein